MKNSRKILVSLALFCFACSVQAEPVWYESKVVEVSINRGGSLFIRTKSNPNPKPCPGAWAGAQWSTDTPESANFAASIALAAKATGSTVRFQIDDQNCGSGGMPIMLWIQGR